MSNDGAFYALGLDLGTTTGWALLRDGIIIGSGEIEFKKPADSGWRGDAHRLDRFMRWLMQFQQVDTIYVERNVGTQKSIAATQTYFGLYNMMLWVCGQCNIVPIDFHTSSLTAKFLKKKPGKGAKKEAFAHRLIDLGWEGAVFTSDNALVNHNEADALAVLHVGCWQDEIDISFD